MANETDWTTELVARLRVLWAEGYTIAEIGRRMSVSKNAVVGKAHRLVLPPRPSPIRAGSTDRKPRTRAQPRVSGPSLPLQPGSIPMAAPVPGPVSVSTQVPLPAPVPISVLTLGPVQRRATVFRPPAACNPCCWPIGEPSTRDFRYCDVLAKPGRPYCSAHAAVAYVRPHADGARGVRTNPGR
jgi:GcrA cell cycle regulator